MAAVAFSQVRVRVDELIDERTQGKSLTVLEAGCGSATHVTLNAAARVVGIDLSQAQLDRHQSLSGKICGDIQTYPLGDERFDLVICWDLLEHLRWPDHALANMTRALAPGGLIVLKLPNADSIKALITKATPHRLHVLVYRWVHRDPTLGTEDRGPFKTYMRRSIAPHRLRTALLQAGLAVQLEAYYTTSAWESVEVRHAALWRLYTLTGSMLQWLSRGRLRLNETELVIVAEVPRAYRPHDAE